MTGRRNEFLTSGQTITFYCDEDSSAIRSVQQIELVPSCFYYLLFRGTMFILDICNIQYQVPTL